MHTRKFGILALVLGGLGVAACNEKTEVVVPPVTPTLLLRIAPKPVSALSPGATVQLIAVVSFSTNQAVTWSSSNTSCANVNPTTGLVTAAATVVTTCTTVITAVSAIDANARDAVTLTVNANSPPTTLPLSAVSILSINQNGTIVPVNPGNVQGRIDAIINVDIPAGVTASAVRVTVSGAEVCRQTFSNAVDSDLLASTVPVTITCTINTAALKADGTPQFPNGLYNVKVEILSPSNTVLAAATSQPLVFNNVSFINVTATPSNPTLQLDPAGLVWFTGDLTVTGQAANFNAGAPVPTSMTITVVDNGVENAGATIATRTVTTNASGVFSFTFTKACNATTATDDVCEAEGPILVNITSVVGGQAGPAGNFAGTLRLDNRAPDDTDADAFVATFVNPANNWYGANTSLTTTTRVANLAELSDEGVNSNTVTYQFTTDLTGVAGWTDFTATSQLPQTSTTNSFLVRARVCDKLSNCVNVTAATPTGSDVTAPTMTATLTNDVILEQSAERTAADEVTISGVENLSGFPVNLVQVQIIRTRMVGGVLTTECLDLAGTVTNDDNAGTGPPAIPSSGCAFIGQPTTAVNIPTNVAGYYQMSSRLVDQAGNTSTVDTRTFLVDDTAPSATVTGMAFTSTQVNEAGTISDNLEVASWTGIQNFAGANPAGSGVSYLPFSAMTAAASFGLPLTTSVAATSTMTIMRQLDGFNISGMGFLGLDLANNDGTGFISFSTTAGNGIDNAAAVGLTTPAPTLSGSSITFTATTNANTDNPIAVVYFYAAVPSSDGGNYIVFLGSDATADLTIGPGGPRNWAYSGFINTSALPSIKAFAAGTPYNITIFAVAADAQGDAVSTAGTVFQVT
jgi:hypothetical protein